MDSVPSFSIIVPFRILWYIKVPTTENLACIGYVKLFEYLQFYTRRGKVVGLVLCWKLVLLCPHLQVLARPHTKYVSVIARITKLKHIARSVLRHHSGKDGRPDGRLDDDITHLKTQRIPEWDAKCPSEAIYKCITNKIRNITISQKEDYCVTLGN